MKSYRPEELFDENGTLIPELAGTGAQGQAAHGRQSARQRRPAAARSEDAGFPRLRRGCAQARARSSREATRVMGQMLRDVMKLNADAANFRVVGPDETASNRLDALFEVTNRESTAEILPNDDHVAARRPRDGSAQRAHVPGLAGRLSAHRPARLLLLLRSLHPHHRFHVQPARQVAEDYAPHSLAAAHRFAELSADLARLAAGPQRLQPSGPRLHRSRGEQEGGHRARLSAAGRQHAALGHRPLPAQPQLRQRDRGRQAARAAVARHGCRHRALHRRHRHLGLGQQRSTASSRTW